LLAFASSYQIGCIILLGTQQTLARLVHHPVPSGHPRARHILISLDRLTARQLPEAIEPSTVYSSIIMQSGPCLNHAAAT
jgi:hypothetical protein